MTGAIGNLPTDTAARAALDVVSGEAYASTRSALVEDSRYVREAALNRLRAGGGGGPAAWGQVFGAWGSMDGDGNAARTDTSTTGILMGADTAVAGTGKAGVLAGYSQTRVGVNARASTASSDNYHLGAYGADQLGPLGLRAGVTYAWRDVHMARSVSMAGFSDHLDSHYQTGGVQAFGEAAYQIDLKPVRLEPYAGAAYVNLGDSAFSEFGGAAALSGKVAGADLTFTNLGLRGAADFTVQGAVVTAKLAASWRHVYGRVTSSSTAAFAGSSAFTTYGAPIARDAVAIDAGLDVAVARTVRIGVAYSDQVAAHDRDHGAKANLSWKF